MKSELAGKAGSAWVATAPKTGYPEFDAPCKADVVVIGAGIVGLSAAYLLARAGLAVVVLEALGIGGQVTGRSTAKITTQHGLIYNHLTRTFNLEAARYYATANRLGIETIASWIEALEIHCDYEPKDAYVYCCDPKHTKELEAEATAAQEAGLAADVVAPAPLPFQTAAALRFKAQAQFNPAQYLVGLARACERAGVRIFEKSRVVSVEKNGEWEVKTRKAALRVPHVIQATNLPIWGPVPFDERTRPRCHIALAFRVDKARIEGMFIGFDDPHSLRMGRDAGGALLVVLGPKFDTGQEGDVAKHFLALEAWSRRNFDIGDVAWRWANEDYDAPERLPFVGELRRAPGLYVATGFSAWGISNGTAAGILIAKQVLGEQPDWAVLYNPEREVPPKFNKGAETQSLVHTLDDIPLGEGRIIPLGRGKIAVHRAKSGEINALSASCTHKGCTVTWNNADKTWDCPCHGSIFAADGSVIHGPAVEPLPQKTLPERWLHEPEGIRTD